MGDAFACSSYGDQERVINLKLDEARRIKVAVRRDQVQKLADEGQVLTGDVGDLENGAYPEKRRPPRPKKAAATIGNDAKQRRRNPRVPPPPVPSGPTYLSVTNVLTVSSTSSMVSIKTGTRRHPGDLSTLLICLIVS